MRPAEWERLRATLARFCGTHSFHNFTPKLMAGDATTNRYVTECAPSRPFLVGEGAAALEFVHVTVAGQSFLMNQIRHMVGLAVDVARGAAPELTLDLAFTGGSLRMPLAPAEGLYLDQCLFVAYDKRFGRDHPSMTHLAPAAAERMRRFK